MLLGWGMVFMMVLNYFYFVFGFCFQMEFFYFVYYLCFVFCLEVNKFDCLMFYYYYEFYGWYWDCIWECIEWVEVDFVLEVLEFDYQDVGIVKYCYVYYLDFVCVDQLFEYGGVYVDIDIFFVVLLFEQYCDYFVVVGCEDFVFNEEMQCVEFLICNVFIVVQMQVFFLCVLCLCMVEVMDGSWSVYFCFFFQQFLEELFDEVEVFDFWFFYCFMWIFEDLIFFFEGFEMDFDGVFSIYFWSYFWWE